MDRQVPCTGERTRIHADEASLSLREAIEALTALGAFLMGIELAVRPPPKIKSGQLRVTIGCCLMQQRRAAGAISNLIGSDPERIHSSKQSNLLREAIEALEMLSTLLEAVDSTVHLPGRVEDGALNQTLERCLALKHHAASNLRQSRRTRWKDDQPDPEANV